MLPEHATRVYLAMEAWLEERKRHGTPDEVRDIEDTMDLVWKRLTAEQRETLNGRGQL